MNVEQMKVVLKEILTKTDLTPCVIGHRGVGKTAGIIQVCRELEQRYVPIRLGQMEVGDLVGIPYREKDQMYWSRPCWWPQDHEESTIIHCDELNRAQQEDTLQAIFQFVEPPAEGQRRALHRHTLDPRHKVVVSINPPDGTYQVAPLDRALLDRMVMIYVETDYSCWARYAKQRQLDPHVQRFLAANPQALASRGSALDMAMEPTERSWEMVSTLRSYCRFPKDLEMEVYAGIVGKEAAVLFLQWCEAECRPPVSAAEVFEQWDEVRDRVAVQRDDQQSVTMNEVITALEVEPSMAELREKNLMGYLSVLPRDMRFALVKALVRIPAVAHVLVKEENDSVVFDAIEMISREAS